MNITEIINSRHSVRDYTSKKVDEASIHQLLNAAVHAPTAMHEEPWVFVVIQNKSLLNRLSDDVKQLLSSGGDPIHPHELTQGADQFIAPAFNVFYNATTLIVICEKPMGEFAAADCWLAAQNLMLSACASGLGSCVIGLAVTALNTPAWKKELGITAEMTAIAPIIVGFPATETPLVSRKLPEVLSWI
ncbi:nitroreductase family protein [Methylomonas sp. AM2-LC]|uniref:nitroreductase family protein n=1 Tax=Methylomonas sp. AM2-LC TaxID=3153301 RepID=UPI0032672E3A